MLKYILLGGLLLSCMQPAWATPHKLEIDLSGLWKFKTGDRMMWAQKELDDRLWDEIHVPAKWEEEGYSGYDGYAWYRIEVALGETWEGREVDLSLGKIDDMDEVFFNGVRIGAMGKMPPAPETAWDVPRNYEIPFNLVEVGKNVIAIRVFDEGGDGGLYEGEHVIRAGAKALQPDIDLSGLWEFTLSKTAYLAPEVYRRTWKNIQVPATWESQGYEGYNGYAYYRKKVRVEKTSPDDLWVLLLGKIDDLDEVYLNGKLIGAMGEMEGEYPEVKGIEREGFRGYYLSRGLLKAKQENEILIKVFDAGGEGGIYQGPIGLISQENYISYWREVSRANKRND